MGHGRTRAISTVVAVAHSYPCLPCEVAWRDGAAPCFECGAARNPAGAAGHPLRRAGAHLAVPRPPSGFRLLSGAPFPYDAARVSSPGQRHLPTPDG